MSCARDRGFIASSHLSDTAPCHPPASQPPCQRAPQPAPPAPRWPSTSGIKGHLTRCRMQTVVLYIYTGLYVRTVVLQCGGEAAVSLKSQFSPHGSPLTPSPSPHRRPSSTDPGHVPRLLTAFLNTKTPSSTPASNFVLRLPTRRSLRLHLPPASSLGV